MSERIKEKLLRPLAFSLEASEIREWDDTFSICEHKAVNI